MKTDITVGIPLYNARKTIKQTLQSIAIQTYQPYEILIIDDCSEETYEDIFSEFENIRVIRQEVNQGVGVARRTLVDNCQSRYLTMIDSDDVFATVGALQIFHDCLKIEQPVFLATSFYQQQEDKGTITLSNAAWCHGKVYDVTYLKTHGLNFNANRTHEEGSLNWFLLDLPTGVSLHYEWITYLWQHNNESITRKGDYAKEHLDDYIYGLRLNYELYKNVVSDIRLKQIAIKRITQAHFYAELLRCLHGEQDIILFYFQLIYDFAKDSGVVDWFIDYPKNDIFEDMQEYSLHYSYCYSHITDFTSQTVPIESVFMFFRRYINELGRS